MSDCGCLCPYGTFPACRRARGDSPCYLEDEAYGPEMDNQHSSPGRFRPSFRHIQARHAGGAGQHAECVKGREAGVTGRGQSFQEQDLLTLCYELRA
jgi:hypothetical protein